MYVNETSSSEKFKVDCCNFFWKCSAYITRAILCNCGEYLQVKIWVSWLEGELESLCGCHPSFLKAYFNMLKEGVDKLTSSS